MQGINCLTCSGICSMLSSKIELIEGPDGITTDTPVGVLTNVSQMFAKVTRQTDS